MTKNNTTDKSRTANKVLAIGGLNGFVSTEVQNSTFVLRINSSAKNPAHRQYLNRYGKCFLNARHKKKIRLKKSKIDVTEF